MKTLIVTGARGGLGQAVVAYLSGHYQIEAIRAELATDAAQAETAVNATVQRAGSIYGLVHLAGGFTADNDSAAWSKMMALNVMTAVNIVRATIPHLERGGRIVAISSSATSSKPAGLGAYVVSKVALNAFIELTAAELKEKKITANAILPGALDTPAMRGQADRSTLVPLDRVAETITFLLSEAGASVTGALIPLSA